MKPATDSTILAINDHFDQLELLRLLLVQAGYRVITAADGQEGLETAQRERPDLIVSDVSMPRMNGIEMCRQIRADAELSSIPVLLVSAVHKDTGSAVAGLQSGADDYLEAPYDPPRLIAKVTRLLDRKGIEDELERRLKERTAQLRAAERRDEEIRAHLATIIESADDAIISSTLDGLIASWNKGAQQIYGYTSSEIISQPITLLVPFERHPEVRAILERIKRGEVIKHYESVWICKDKRAIHISLTVSPIKDSKGNVTGASLIARDITEQKQAEEAQRESEARYKQLVEHASDLIYQTDAEGYFTYANPAVGAVLSYSQEEFQRMHYLDVIHPEHRKEAERFYARQLFKKIPETYYEFLAVGKDGTAVWLGQHVRILLAKEEVDGFQAVARDITKRKQGEERLYELSLTDDLTGLYNRRGFIALAEKQLELAKRKSINELVLFYADMDNLKTINDRFGHEEGSEAIKNIADILKKTFRGADIIARLGGDEFTILGADISPTSEEILKTRLEKNICQYNERGDCLYELSLSLGVVRIDTASEDSIREWLIKADDAMYKDKRNKQKLHFNRTLMV
jgi:diguanylate cyclase (GGDEF)-like protein/PAS domain S-box-containing protein